jgi:hypothetical protein
MRLKAAAGRGAEAFATDGRPPTGAGMDTLSTRLIGLTWLRALLLRAVFVELA